MNQTTDIETLERVAAETRLRVLEMSSRAKTAHLGGALSCIDILTALYGAVLRIDPEHPENSDRDRCILSKGHAISAMYACLAKWGFFPEAELVHYNAENSRLPEQPSPGCAPGIEWATGSLGHGLSVALGMALAGRMAGRSYNCYAVMSDGECEEGSIWEAAMMAAQRKVDRLVAIVDYNKLQATGRVNEIMAMDPLPDKWRAFGWHCQEVDGHDMGALVAALERARAFGEQPSVIVAHTVKGKGVSFMEDDNNWHYRSPTEEEVKTARIELGLADASLLSGGSSQQ